MSAPPRISAHPLDPLSADELALAAAIVSADGRLGDRLVFSVVETLEPPKDHLDAGPPREAFAALLDTGSGTTYEAVVDLAGGTVRALRAVPGAHIAHHEGDFATVERVVKADPRHDEALALRGLRADDVSVGLFPAGNRDRSRWPGRRIARSTTWVTRDRLPDTCPVEGIVAVVDLVTDELLEFSDHGPKPVPPAAPSFLAAEQRALRDDLRPLAITQPDGVSFALEGSELRWQRWRMRLGFTAREGLVLHTVGYEDGGAVRSIAHRLSLSEMVVPYGDPSPAHNDRAVFDGGEINMGTLANSLQLGCDCLGEIRYVDAVVADADGTPRTIANAICIHEEDHGVLWKHSIPALGIHEVRRSRRLVVSWFATVSNYDYGFYWSFYEDGSIELEAKLTGVVLVAALDEGESPVAGERVAPGLAGINHQHHFCVRLDLDVDGPRNTVVESEAEAVAPGPQNPNGNAFTTRRTVLGSEAQARRDADPMAARSWTVVNPERRNAHGGPVGYRLVPGENVRALAADGSRSLARAGFLRHHLWVTPNHAAERYAAGAYPTLADGSRDGLHVWSQADRPLEGEDVVLWYVFGHHHVPRPEDWPVMPVWRMGFSLKPSGFFDANPALDVAPPAPAHGSQCHPDPSEEDR
jgi:primary-amine oxidase